MSRLPSEYKIILMVIFLIAVPSAVLCYISLFALGQEEKVMERKLKVSYEGALENVTRRTIEELTEEEEAIQGLVNQLVQRSYTFHTAWNLFSGLSKPQGLFQGVYLFDSQGAALYPRLGPNPPESTGDSAPPDPTVLAELQQEHHRCLRVEFAQGGTDVARDAYKELAESAIARAGPAGAPVAAEALLGLARCLERLGNHRRALEVLDMVVYRYPGEVGTAQAPLAPGALLMKSDILERLGDTAGRQKTLLDLAMFLARNEDAMTPRFVTFFRERLFALGGERLLGLYTSHRERVRTYRSFVEAFEPLVKETAASYSPRNATGHLRSGHRLAFYAVLSSHPQGPGAKGVVLFEVNPDYLAERFGTFARDAGLQDRVRLARPDRENALPHDSDPSRPVAASRPFPRPLQAWEVRFTDAGLDGLSTLTKIRWSIYFWVILIASAVLVGGILFVIRRVSREMRLSRDRSDFLSNVTHDLKTPLTSIRMFIDTLRLGRVKDQADVDECLSVMAGETDRLTRLIERVLDYSKLERGTRRYTMRRVDLRQVIEQTLAIFQNQIEEDAFELVDQYSLDLPPAKADPDAIIEVLLNLLDNALKYSPIEKRITLRAGAGDGRVSVAVLDRGVGIVRKDLDRIFDPFFRADDSRHVDGTGLGLAHSYRVMQDHGGDILVESEPGRGSIFTLRLPLWKD